MALKITTWNVNGLRAALRKGFERYLDEIAPDILLLQEIRVRPEQLPQKWANPTDWHVHWNPAQKAGYSGTAIWSRHPFQDVAVGLAPDVPDDEGRIVTVKVADVQISSVYLPSGSSGEARQAVKDTWLQNFREACNAWNSDFPVLFGGDLNIAHTKRDIFHWKSNQKTSGFLPHEREWMTELLESGWTDLIRQHFGDCDGPYSWWSNRGKARELDRGWRIDYLIANALAAKRFVSASIHREAGLACSDHAPVTIEISDD